MVAGDNIVVLVQVVGAAADDCAMAHAHCDCDRTHSMRRHAVAAAVHSTMHRRHSVVVVAVVAVAVGSELPMVHVVAV